MSLEKPPFLSPKCFTLPAPEQGLDDKQVARRQQINQGLPERWREVLDEFLLDSENERTAIRQQINQMLREIWEELVDVAASNAFMQKQNISALEAVKTHFRERAVSGGLGVALLPANIHASGFNDFEITNYLEAELDSHRPFQLLKRLVARKTYTGGIFDDLVREKYIEFNNPAALEAFQKTCASVASRQPVAPEDIDKAVELFSSYKELEVFFEFVKNDEKCCSTIIKSYAKKLQSEKQAIDFLKHIPSQQFVSLELKKDVEHLLQQKIIQNIDCVTYQTTALVAADEKGHSQVVECLLDVGDDFYESLQRAIEKKRTELVSKILASGKVKLTDERRAHLLYFAANKNYSNVMIWVLSGLDDIKKWESIIEAVSWFLYIGGIEKRAGFDHLVKTLGIDVRMFSREIREKLLLSSSIPENYKLILRKAQNERNHISRQIKDGKALKKEELESITNINADEGEDNLLVVAIVALNHQAAEQILESKKIDVTTRNLEIALRYAMSESKNFKPGPEFKIAELILKKIPKIDKSQFVTDALLEAMDDYADYDLSIEAADFLIKHGANINAKGEDEYHPMNRPLVNAIYRCKWKLAAHFLQKGALPVDEVRWRVEKLEESVRSAGDEDDMQIEEDQAPGNTPFDPSDKDYQAFKRVFDEKVKEFQARSSSSSSSSGVSTAGEREEKKEEQRQEVEATPDASGWSPGLHGNSGNAKKRKLGEVENTSGDNAERNVVGKGVGSETPSAKPSK